MSYRQLSEDTAKIIIASWLQGEHAEDVRLVPVGLFPSPYMEIAKDIRGGLDTGGLVKRHGAKLITDTVTSYSPVLYRNAVREVLTAEMHRTLPDGANPEQVKAHAEKFARYWAEPPKPSDLTVGYFDTLAKRKEQEPIDSGIPALDDYTNGIYPGQLTIVAARPGTGKSAFCLQVAYKVASKGRKVLFLPLEMSAAETVDRIVMRFADVPYKDLRSGRLSTEQIREVSAVIDNIDAMNDRFRVYENVRHISAIEELIRQEHPDLIVIDQLSQIQTDGAPTTRERYIEITRRLKAIALAEDVAIWLPCQMNRESSKTGAVSMDYLKESGSIEEDADIVVILTNQKDDNGKFKTDGAGRLVTMEIAKNRQGISGEKQTLSFVASRFTFRSHVSGFVETDGEPPF